MKTCKHFALYFTVLAIAFNTYSGACGNQGQAQQASGDTNESVFTFNHENAFKKIEFLKCPSYIILPNGEVKCSNSFSSEKRNMPDINPEVCVAQALSNGSLYNRAHVTTVQFKDVAFQGMLESSREQLSSLLNFLNEVKSGEADKAKEGACSGILASNHVRNKTLEEATILAGVITKNGENLLAFNEACIANLEEEKVRLDEEDNCSDADGDGVDDNTNTQCPASNENKISQVDEAIAKYEADVPSLEGLAATNQEVEQVLADINAEIDAILLALNEIQKQGLATELEEEPPPEAAPPEEAPPPEAAPPPAGADEGGEDDGADDGTDDGADDGADDGGTDGGLENGFDFGDGGDDDGFDITEVDGGDDSNDPDDFDVTPSTLSGAGVDDDSGDNLSGAGSGDGTGATATPGTTSTGSELSSGDPALGIGSSASGRQGGEYNSSKGLVKAKSNGAKSNGKKKRKLASKGKLSKKSTLIKKYKNNKKKKRSRKKVIRKKAAPKEAPKNIQAFDANSGALFGM